MRISTAFLLLAAAAVCVVATPVPYKSCGSSADTLTITSLDATPWPPASGKPITVNFVGSLSEDITAANFDATVSLDGIPVISKTGDACKLVSGQCPVKAGPINLSKTIDVPTIPISGAVTVKLSAKDQSGKEITCVSVNVNLPSAESDFMHPGQQQQQPQQPPKLTAESLEINGAFGEWTAKQINSDPQSSWTAGKNHYFDGWTVGELKKWMQTTSGAEDLPQMTYSPSMVANLPASFDATQQWPGKIGPILNQGSCGSCWAFGAAECISDRFAIKTGNFTQYAPLDLVTCDYGFGANNGCNGGALSTAWQYVQYYGLATEQCMPYLVSEGGPIPTCAPKDQPCLKFVNTPTCEKQCHSGSSVQRTKINSVYTVEGEANMMAELVKNGPIELQMTVYSDFVHYKSGVYVQSSSAQPLGGHAIRLIGYGTDEASGLKYWKVANSWTTTWGDEGYFKIVRGRDECGIESGAVAGQV